MSDEIDPSTIINVELIDIIFALHEKFEGTDKVSFWLNTENPHLGCVKPSKLILLGRGHKVLQFIRSVEDHE
jgi:hypothetical protein